MGNLKKYAGNERGSALVAVFMVLVLLVVLGAGLMVLSVGSARQSVAADTYEKAYYPAEGASRQGIEYVKQAALTCYNGIADDLRNNVLSSNNAASFFTAMESYMSSPATRFSPSPLDLSAGAAVKTLNSSVNAAVVSPAARAYTVDSTALGDAASRTVRGTITVKFVPLQRKFIPFGDKALIVGNDLDLTRVKQGTLLQSPDGIEVDPLKIRPDTSNVDPGSPIYPPPADRNLDWVLTFNSFSSFISGITPNYEPADIGKGTLGFKNLTINSGGMYVVGAADTPFTLDNVSLATDGRIVCYGDLTINDGELNDVSIVCKGDMYIDGCTINRASIYCGGTLYVRAGNGKVTTVDHSIVYAYNVNVGANGNGKTQFVSGLLYSYTDITISGNKTSKEPDTSSYTGQVVARQNTILTDYIPNKNAMFRYDPNILVDLPQLMKSLGAAPFISSLTAHNDGDLYKIIQPVNDDIFSGGSVNEISGN